MSARLAQASLLLPWSEFSLDGVRARVPVKVVGVAVEASGSPLARHERDIAAITYAADPDKKGLGAVLEAWARARREGEELVVAGAADVPAAPGVNAVGLLPRPQYRALLRRSRIYLTAPRREDYGIAQLEALADGCMLVTTPAPGPYEALRLARALDPRLVTGDLVSAIRAALDDPQPGYAQRAARELQTFSASHIDAIVAGEVLPALTAGA
jgi:glycosyltransferase involved in cell wall biosynthesis